MGFWRKMAMQRDFGSKIGTLGIMAVQRDF